MQKFTEKIMQKFREKCKISRKKSKNTEFLKQTQNFSEKVANIHQKRLNFENTRFIFK